MSLSTAVRTAVLAAAFLPGAAARLASQERVDTTFAARGSPRLSVSTHSGTVTITGWSRNQIRVQAESDDRARVEVNETGGRVNVRTVARHGSGEVDYTISVPSGTAVEVGGISSDVSVTGVCGEISVNTVSGDVSVSCAAGLATIQSVSGDVVAREIRGDLDVGSTSGDVAARGVRGRVSAHAVSGDLSLSDVAGGDVNAESVSGDISYSGAIQDNGRYRFESHSGEVMVRIVGSANASFTVSTFSGEFESDFPIELVPGARISREWQFRLGNGSARVRLQSFSGTVYLKRGAGSPREE